jgi:hypothetical protein
MQLIIYEPNILEANLQIVQNTPDEALCHQSIHKNYN